MSTTKTTTSLRDQLRHDPELRDQLQHEQAQRAAAATKRYRALLLASDPADRARLEELHDVMATLGLTLADVDADAAAIAAHAAATAAALSPGQRADAEAEVAKAWADARAEARGVVLQIFDRLSRDTFLNAVYDFYSSAVQSAQGGDLAEIAKLNCFERLWGQVNGAERAAARRLDQAKTVDAKLAALAAAHPRVLGPDAEAEAEPEELGTDPGVGSAPHKEPEGGVMARARENPRSPTAGRKGHSVGRDAPGRVAGRLQLSPNQDETSPDDGPTAA